MTTCDQFNRLQGKLQRRAPRNTLPIKIFEVIHSERDAVKGFVAGLGYLNFRDLAFGTGVYPRRTLFAELGAVHVHGRGKNLYTVELHIGAENYAPG